jgi:AcrR family transcriptional regulator
MNREFLLDKATQLLVANNGASMQEIAAAAGIGRATLHRHFANRDDLMREITDAILTEAEQRLATCRLNEGSVLQVLERVVEAFVPMGHRYYFLSLEMPSDLTPEATAAFKERERRLTETFEILLRRGQTEGVLRSDLPVWWLDDTLTKLLFSVWERINTGYIAPRDAARFVLTTFLDGMSVKGAN